MSAVEGNQFHPDYAIHPGEILMETLEARNMRKSELAERCGLSPKTVSLIINGKAPITPETAIQLERVLGVSANLWTNIDANYRLQVAKASDYQELGQHTEWVKNFPVQALMKLGLIRQTRDPTEQVSELLNFFGIGNVSIWDEYIESHQIAYRRSHAFKSSWESVYTWLRIGELFAEGIECEPYDKDAFKNALYEIKDLTCETPKNFEPVMKELCRKAGVALVFVAELPKTHLSGAARWLHKDKALIMLSLRHKKNDHFWFSFFHEAGHLILHSKKSSYIDEAHPEDSEQECEANQFACNMLISEQEYDHYCTSRKL